MRALRTALLLTAGLLLGPGAAAALAGPGITFYPKAGPVLQLSGAQISASANLPARTYTLPDDSSQPGKKVTLRGLSIGALVARSGQGAQRVQIVNSHGGSFVVTPAQFGSAFLSDDGTTTRFIRSSGGILSEFTEDSSVPLEVSVDGGDLAIKATASPKRVREGESVTFSANVRFGAPGANYTYQWEFGEGPVQGQRVTYTPDIPGTLFAQVEVNAGPGCTARCGGTERVTVEVGEAPEEPEDTTAGGANGTPGGAGSSGGTGGGGAGGSGGGSGSGTGTGGEGDSTPAPAKPEPEPKPPPPPPKPFGTTISGVLINDAGTTAQKLPGGEPAGGAEGVRAVRGGDAAGGFPLGLSGLLAMGVMWIGALRERRAVRLRVA